MVRITRKHSCDVTTSFSGERDDGTSDRGNPVFDKMETLNRKSVIAEVCFFTINKLFQPCLMWRGITQPSRYAPGHRCCWTYESAFNSALLYSHATCSMTQHVCVCSTANLQGHNLPHLYQSALSDVTTMTASQHMMAYV